MLNLLFISDSPKAEYIKGVLQPVLKVFIDVVTDFDHGLKDVFEKRPATVFIHDQIGGVTGESVARHIQMLLGNSAPKFILLHTGNGKARAIKGLYEHLIDLSQSNETVAEDIINTLKSLLGVQWGKIYIPPKQAPASVRLSAAVPETSREDADKLVDDFLSDLETTGFSAGDDQLPVASVTDKVEEESSGDSQSGSQLKPENVPGTFESDRAQSINDDLAELFLMEADKAARNEIPVTGSSAVIPPSAESAISTPGIKTTRSAPAPVIASPPPAAEFRISQDTLSAEEDITEDLLLVFDENYRAESLFLRHSFVIAVVCVVCAAGGWYLVRHKPELADSLKRRLIPSTTAKQAPVTPPASAPVQRPVPPPVRKPEVAPSIPAFIPKDGHDGSFSVKNPGWERYIGKRNEFRLFSHTGRMQAVQVLALKGAPIPESLMKSVLQEFVGSQEYRLTSHDTKAGLLIENGKILNKGEVKIYRKNGAVLAFVVSLN